MLSTSCRRTDLPRINAAPLLAELQLLVVCRQVPSEPQPELEVEAIAHSADCPQSLSVTSCFAPVNLTRIAPKHGTDVTHPVTDGSGWPCLAA